MPNENENLSCPICTIQVADNTKGLLCEQCFTWYHSDCLHYSDAEYERLSHSNDPWYCDHCSSIRANKIKWGSFETERDISLAITNSYNEIITWRKNFFSLPRGKSGTDFLKELTRLIYLFADKTRWERLSLSLVHIFVPLMLQKPGPKSKAKDHAKYLASRLEMWSQGNLKGLMDECRQIQKRLQAAKARKQESNEKAFCRLMLLGKVRQACKFIDDSSSIVGVHKVSEQIRDTLAAKHPSAESACPSVLLPITNEPPNNVIYELITPDLVQSCSKRLQGSGGPTLVDSDTWRYFLNSRAYGKRSYFLAEAVAKLAKRLGV